ncbi:hypothetical protein CLAFUW4_08684 [Fulvia fulva]|uniref:Heterokaryon incompatibility domain-containing protein n=1 Tax=Passalora fulva TaxID=5499 RepID=A0A9Q8LEA3_PASFU|nr:uncharacterized protein CLAFUR5_08781 [Fulvia fulva]KAK4628891.1 hypothetical protein CLAFUR4_08686 [Fulvia fulva]KAK4630058.1 hypothetical protein CLAFUR0_08682 [Fulvia fulva]UJO15639.1 hypothetical protein CLAFUR5_08781 [Fulvia fulva]WPV12858.1 hypothetical protein CLAFUW4_08684 [Fulvia fulva]WPV27984.1 hypothetical protein CLAFUW7_08681 [Fulvia fulva]
MPSKRSAESTPQRGSKRLKEHTPEAKRARLYQAVDASRKEIRLLVVAAGAKDDPVRGTFRHVSLLDDPKPVFETISYVWGDPKLRATMFLHGLLIGIPKSSERVLRRMRHRHCQRK